ncbi:MAG: L-threonylcarbamoyladenylate synthase [Kiritimatiellia bacterium]
MNDAKRNNAWVQLSTLLARTGSGYELDVTRLLCLAHDEDIELAVEALLEGYPLACGFGNFYAIFTKADQPAVEQMNRWKGRPASQVGSLSTTPLRVPSLFDFAQLPDNLDEKLVLDVMEAFTTAGPIGFRGPAAPDLPAHMTSRDGDMLTAQTIVPGYRCPSNKLISRAIEQLPERYLYVTSANLSSALSGKEEPAHWKPAPLIFDFRHVVDLKLIRHESEDFAHAMYPGYAEMSTSVLSFHRAESEGGRRALRLERHGSLHVDRVREILDRLDLGLVIAPTGETRLLQRDYDFDPQ